MIQSVSGLLVCNVCRCVAPAREDLLIRHSRLLLRLMAEQKLIDKAGAEVPQYSWTTRKGVGIQMVNPNYGVSPS